MVYKNVKEIAYKVFSHINKKGGYTLKSLQGNEFYIGLAQYDWPAFQHGKYVFHNSVTDSKNIFCGLHIERGLMNTKYEPYMLSDKWIGWRKFYSDWKRGKIDDKLQKIESYAGHSLTRIDVSNAGSKNYDRLIFKQKDGIILNETIQIEEDSGLLPKYSYRNPKDAFDILINKENQNLPDSWVDCYVGFEVDLGKAGIVNGKELYEKGLSVFDEYLIAP